MVALDCGRTFLGRTIFEYLIVSKTKDPSRERLRNVILAWLTSCAKLLTRKIGNRISRNENTGSSLNSSASDFATVCETLLGGGAAGLGFTPRVRTTIGACIFVCGRST